MRRLNVVNQLFLLDAQVGTDIAGEDERPSAVQFH